MFVAARSFRRFLSVPCERYSCSVNLALDNHDDLKIKLLDIKDDLLKDVFHPETGNLPFGICMLFEIIKYKKYDDINKKMYAKNVKLFTVFLKNKILQNQRRNNEEYRKIMHSGNFFGFSTKVDELSTLKYSYDCANVLNKIKDDPVKFYEDYIYNNDRFTHLFGTKHENAKANEQISHTELMIVYWITEYITENYCKWIDNAYFVVRELSPYSIVYRDDATHNKINEEINN
jgi:hypothetical protein